MSCLEFRVHELQRLGHAAGEIAACDGACKADSVILTLVYAGSQISRIETLSGHGLAVMVRPGGFTRTKYSHRLLRLG
jgi:hypothetical protein